ncbi:CdaR family protein [Alkaliphilus oremlandii]|uniref:YbbR family protein n=1 Tax=Alkaliphilus oremlandii (strain OhILAs) TaxID=350688 RepID=A8MJG6_ALKOO|nr:CdaR family protein [Alkaliphilus oremlandii]ABW19948.1 YbbR family protein [Alkaliphilus oremlandii OhILAs]
MNKTGINNLAPKIISILFSLILWIYVMEAFNPKESRSIPNIPVNLVNVEELKEQDMALVGGEGFTVRAKITGRRDEIYKIKENQIQVKADLRGYKLGSNTIPLEVSAPSNIEIDISPRFIRVDLEGIVKKSKDVKVIISGKPKQNFDQGTMVYKPTAVWVEGPESYVNAVENVVATLDITGEGGSLSSSLALKPVNSRGEEVKNVKINTPYVDVSLDIAFLKSVPVKGVHELKAAEGYKITEVKLSASEVILRGDEELLNNISEVSTEKITLDQLTENQSVHVKLELPENVSVQGEAPIKLDVTVEKLEEKIYKINRENILFNNLGENLKLDKSSIPESLNITITGLKSILDTIDKNVIRVEVDLAELSANEYTIEPVVTLPFIIEKDIAEVRLEPKSIKIKLLKQ